MIRDSIDVYADKQICDMIFKSMRPRTKLIFKLRHGFFGATHTYREIGELVGISACRVHQILVIEGKRIAWKLRRCGQPKARKRLIPPPVLEIIIPSPRPSVWATHYLSGEER